MVDRNGVITEAKKQQKQVSSNVVKRGGDDREARKRGGDDRGQNDISHRNSRKQKSNPGAPLSALKPEATGSVESNDVASVIERKDRTAQQALRNL